jgi:hypothetical protein
MLTEKVYIGYAIRTCNDPGFYQILGKFFFAFALLEMIEISQGFKTFELI